MALRATRVTSRRTPRSWSSRRHPTRPTPTPRTRCRNRPGGPVRAFRRGLGPLVLGERYGKRVDPLAGDDPRQVGAYRLHARLGAGGMGRVYLGYSPGGRAVAVKIVHPELARDAEFMTRFEREVQAAEAVSGAYT